VESITPPSVDRAQFSELLRSAIIRSNRVGAQTHLAEEVGCTPSLISRYCNPKDTVWPTLETFLKICQALGMSPDEVLKMESSEARHLRRELGAADKALQGTRDLIEGYEMIRRQNPALRFMAPIAKAAHLDP